MVNEEVQKHEAVEQSDKFRTWLKDNDACDDSLEWLQGRTARQAWDECERADWLLWWAAKSEVDRRLLIRVACQCARRALRFVPEGEPRPLQAIETAEAWCEGKATIAEVRKAAADAKIASASAYSSGYVAYANKHSYSACYAAAYAAQAAYYASYAAGADNAAANAGDAADVADNVTEDACTGSDEHIAMCAIIREYIDFEAVWNA